VSTDVSEEHFASILRISEKINQHKSISLRSASYLLHAGFLLGLFFYPEDGGDMFLRNVG
jgi:hypothetical protein